MEARISDREKPNRESAENPVPQKCAEKLQATQSTTNHRCCGNSLTIPREKPGLEFVDRSIETRVLRFETRSRLDLVRGAQNESEGASARGGCGGGEREIDR